MSQAGEYDGDRKLPSNGAVDLVSQRLAFFDKYLKDKKNVTVQEDKVRIYITGAPNSNVNKWFNFSTFPVKGTKYHQLYLDSNGDARSFPGDGRLRWTPPSNNIAGTSFDSYTYTPAIPVDYSVSENSSQDMRNYQIRSDVLTYTSEPLKRSLTILGDIVLVLHAASDCPDTDWYSMLTEVFPDGRSISFQYAPRAFRARYREGLDHEIFLTKNKPEEFIIQMGSAGHKIMEGNRLRLSISSSAFPGYDPNHNTGRAVSTDTESQIANQTIFHYSDRPSHIIIPSVEL